MIDERYITYAKVYESYRRLRQPKTHKWHLCIGENTINVPVR